MMELRVNGRREPVRPGTHLCQLFTLEDDAASFAAAFLSMGARNGYRTVYSGPAARAQAIREVLLSDAAESEQEAVAFEHASSRGDFLLHNRLDPYHLLSLHQSAIDRAVSESWRGLCLVLDMTWLAGGASTVEQVVKYEAAAESVFPYQSRPVVMLVQYQHTRATDALAAELLRIHPVSIIGRIIRRNPQHVDAEEYLRQLMQPRRPQPAPEPLPFPGERHWRSARFARGPLRFP
jgi:hypothetical protein